MKPSLRRTGREAVAEAGIALAAVAAGAMTIGDTRVSHASHAGRMSGREASRGPGDGPLKRNFTPGDCECHEADQALPSARKSKPDNKNNGTRPSVEANAVPRSATT